METIVNALDEALVLDTTVDLSNGYMVVVGTTIVAMDDDTQSEILEYLTTKESIGGRPWIDRQRPRWS